MLRTTFRRFGGQPLKLGRFYHSRDHTLSNIIIDSGSVVNKVLTKSLEYVPQFGFDSRCITQAIRELDYSDSIQSGISASLGGNTLEYLLVLHWLKVQRQKLLEEVENPKSELHGIEEEYKRVAFLVNKRLEYNVPIVGQLSSGISQLIVPYNITQSMEELHNLSDDIVAYAGDRSNDFAWYTKRFGVSSIYVSSELYMLQDISENFCNTHQFVKSKVQQLSDMGSAYNDVEEWGFFNAISLVNLIKSQLLRG